MYKNDFLIFSVCLWDNKKFLGLIKNKMETPEDGRSSVLSAPPPLLSASDEKVDEVSNPCFLSALYSTFSFSLIFF